MKRRCRETVRGEPEGDEVLMWPTGEELWGPGAVGKARVVVEDRAEPLLSMDEEPGPPVGHGGKGRRQRATTGWQEA